MILITTIRPARFLSQSQQKRNNCYLMVIRINRNDDVGIPVLLELKDMKYGVARIVKHASGWASRWMSALPSMQNFRQTEPSGRKQKI